MPTVQQDILDAFFTKLSKSGSIDSVAADALRQALTSGKKLKAEDFVAIFTKEPSSAKP